jgi:predicted nucleic acid-binding protein
MSRFPPPYRLPPAEAWRLVRESFVDLATEVVALDAPQYRQLIESAVARGVVGGTIYDAVIVACAVAAGVDVILTFNDRHFRPLVPPTMRVVVPS